MTANNKMTWFEVTSGNGGWSYPTLAEAKKQIVEMSEGFLGNQHMSDENRDYWKKVSSYYYITKVVQTTKKVI